MKQYLLLVGCVCMSYAIQSIPRDAKIYVAGHTGLVGTSLMRALKERGFANIITRTRSELDLRNQAAVEQFFATEKPAYVFLASAKVGGIKANATQPAEFIYDNLTIETNIIHAAYRHQVTKLLFLGSSCIYPRSCAQPIKEEYLLTGLLEETNKPYAIAKIAGLMLCQSYNKQYGTRFISCMPTNLFGIFDNFNPETSHVIPGLIYKFHRAKIEGAPQVRLWGTGSARREFLFVDDLADALLFLMDTYEEGLPINVGTGTDVSIAELAALIADVVGYRGDIVYDGNTYYDGTPQKLLSVDRINALGWRARTSLRAGLEQTYQWYSTSLSKKSGPAFSSVCVE